MNRFKSIILFATLFCWSGLAFGKQVIRLGTLAPKGSSWHRILEQMARDIKLATDGEVIVRIYAGGVLGDESEMIRKMRIGQLQAAAISNAGLGEIDRTAYALTLPLMFRSYEEWDYVRNHMNPALKESLREKKFEVLAWSDVGWLYFFTKTPMQHPDQLKKMKLATSATEPAATDIFKWSGFNPVPIATVDMMTGLQTGLINAFFLPSILAEGSQLFRHAKHMTALKWAPLQGALLMTGKSWEKLSEAQREKVREIALDVGTKLKAETRDQERRSLEAMKKRGLEVWPVDDQARAAWEKVVQDAYPQIKNKLIPADLFAEIEKHRDAYRAGSEQE